MPETVMIRVHPEFINCHTGATGVFSGKERGTVGRTHRTAGDGVAEIRTFCRKPVNIGCMRAGIPGITTRLVAELIGENIDEIGAFFN